MVHFGGKNILFDPFITPNPLAKDVDITTLRPDLILISHGHGDHIADAEQIAKASNAQVLAAYEITEWLQAKGINKCIPVNIGGSVDFGLFKVKTVVAQHSSSFPDGTYAGHPVGFVVSSSSKAFYYAGDTGLTYDMKLIGEDFDLDFAMLPIGDHFTMGIKDASKAAQFISCNDIIGMHYDTFPPIEIDRSSAVDQFKEDGRTLHLPTIKHVLKF